MNFVGREICSAKERGREKRKKERNKKRAMVYEIYVKGTRG